MSGQRQEDPVDWAPRDTKVACRAGAMVVDHLKSFKMAIGSDVMVSRVATHAHEVVVRKRAREQRTSAETSRCRNSWLVGWTITRVPATPCTQQQNKQPVYLMSFLYSVTPVPTDWDASRNSGSCLERGIGIDIDIDADAEKLLG